MIPNAVRKTVPKDRKPPAPLKEGEQRCTYSGFKDEPYGGPTCCEPTTHWGECKSCFEFIARCDKHGGKHAMTVVLEQHPCHGFECNCWEGVNDREGKRPCLHYRLAAGADPFYNTDEPGACRCGAMGPPWRHTKDCAHD